MCYLMVATFLLLSQDMSALVDVAIAWKKNKQLKCNPHWALNECAGYSKFQQSSKAI